MKVSFKNFHLRTLLCLFIFSLFIVDCGNYVWDGEALAAEYYVTSNSAYDLQNAIDSAADGDIIHVATGTYNLPVIIRDLETNDIIKRIDDITIDRSLTLLSDNSSTVIKGGGLSIGNRPVPVAKVTVDGFTITESSITGIYIDGIDDVTIQNCVVSNNNTSTSYGGGIYIFQDPSDNYTVSTTITNCIITNNTLETRETPAGGGGIFFRRGENLTITDSTITGNTYKYSDGGIPGNARSLPCGGGGIGVLGGTKVIIKNCTVANNVADDNGGGIYCAPYDLAVIDMEIKNCTVANNTAIDFGGGISCNGSLCTLTNCEIIGNTAGYSGGIYNGSEMIINECTIANNIANADYSSNYGVGGIDTSGSLKLANSTITGNTAGYCGGIYVDGEMDIVNCTIINNTATEENPYAHEIYWLGYNTHSSNIVNTLLWNVSKDNSVIVDPVYTYGHVSFDHCAFPEGTIFGENTNYYIMTSNDTVYLSNEWKPISFDVQVEGIHHKIFKLSNDINEELRVLVGTAKLDWDIPSVDQTGAARTHSTIGAVDFDAPLISYDITYELNGGTADNPVKYTRESPDITLNDPTKKGYDFTGWTGTDLTEETMTVTIPKGSKGNREYTATWTPTIYIISYDLKNGTFSENPITSYTIETETFTLKNPAKNGYQFDGWTGTDLTAKTQTVTIAKGSTENRNYTANFTPITYKLTYDLNGGTLTKENPSSYTVETPAFTLSNPTKPGYTFAGWTYNGSTNVEMKINVGSIGDKTFTATWTPTAYKISYNLNGGTVSGNPESYTIETETFTLNNPVKEGYEFIGWTGTDLTTASMEVKISKGSTGDRSYTATYNEEEGKLEKPVLSGSSFSLTAYKGQNATLTITATEGTEIQWNIGGNLPDGLTFRNSDTVATISGTPENGTSGNYSCIITASNSAGSANADVSITVKSDFEESGDVQVSRPVTTVNETGESVTSSTTLFKNGAGNLILSADIAITTESNDFVIFVGELFTTRISVDVTVNLADPDYDSYNYLTDIVGLPEWLEISGDVKSSDVIEEDTATYHHEFKLTGTPLAEKVEKLTLKTSVKISGDQQPVLEAAASKDITISSEAVLISLDVSISGSENLTLQAGNSNSLTLNAKVEGLYSDGITEALSEGYYTLEWSTLSDDLSDYGMSFRNGTLTVNSSAAAGVYRVPVKVAAKVEDITDSAEKIITVTVNNASSETPETPPATPDTPVTPPAEDEPDSILETTSDEVLELSDEELERTFGGEENIALTGVVNNDALTKILDRLSAVTTVKTLDLSSTEGLTEVKLGENNSVENITLAGNQTIKTVEVKGNSSLKTLDVTGSGVERVDAGNCENLEELNIQNCESLEYLDISGTNVESVNVKGCKNLETLNCKSANINSLNLNDCENLKDINLEQNSLMKFNAAVFTKLETFSCSGQSLFVQIVQWSSVYRFVFPLLSSLSAAAEDTTDGFTAEDLTKVQDVQAFDKNGASIPVTYDSTTGEMIFEKKPATVKYNYATGFNDNLMDVTFSSEQSDTGGNNNNPTYENNEDTEVGSSGSGCDSGFGYGIMLLLFAFLHKFSKK